MFCDFYRLNNGPKMFKVLDLVGSNIDLLDLALIISYSPQLINTIENRFTTSLLIVELIIL